MFDARDPTKSDGASVARARYLEVAYDLIRSTLLPEAPKRDAVALAYSFPSRRIQKVMGQCHYLDKAPKKQTEQHLILVAPMVWASGELDVLETLAHEMCHASLPKKTGHRAPFAKLALRIGLDGKPTATTPSPAFKLWVKENRRKLPEYPGGVVLSFTAKKQTTRLRLFECQCDPPVKVRIGRDTFDATCNVCEEAFEGQT